VIKICVPCQRIISEEADHCPDCGGDNIRPLEILPQWVRDMEKDAKG